MKSFTEKFSINQDLGSKQPHKMAESFWNMLTVVLTKLCLLAYFYGQAWGIFAGQVNTFQDTSATYTVCTTTTLLSGILQSI